MDGGDHGSPRGAESRERMVDAAVELVVEHHADAAGVREAFAYLTPGAVAARAGLSRALLYHHWGDDPDGRGAFAAFLGEVADRLWELPAVPEELAELARALPDRLDELVPTLCDHELERATGDQTAVFRAGQAMVLAGVLPRHAGPETVRRLAVLYAGLAERLGIEPVPPLTYEDIAAAVSATIEGFVLTANILPDRMLDRVEWHPPGSDDPVQWRLLSIAVDGVLRNMTRPVTPPGA